MYPSLLAIRFRLIIPFSQPHLLLAIPPHINHPSAPLKPPSIWNATTPTYLPTVNRIGLLTRGELLTTSPTKRQLLGHEGAQMTMKLAVSRIIEDWSAVPTASGVG